MKIRHLIAQTSVLLRQSGFWATALLTIGTTVALSLVLGTDNTLPSGSPLAQWLWFDRTAPIAGGCILLSALVTLGMKVKTCSFSVAVSRAFMILGAVEAVWGLCQLYGWAMPGHAQYVTTGSFFNPGPYAGYLALTLPICFHSWLTGSSFNKHLSGLALVLILCILPATMSRSAWVAAAVSCLWVYGCLKGWKMQFVRQWHTHRRRTGLVIAGGIAGLLIAGSLLFMLKPDSARGRLFMWKISGRALAEKPWTGQGIGQFSAAYGKAQEQYFAQRTYAAWEERVAGSPEYAFNEYLQAAVETGIPATILMLALVGAGWYKGVREKRYGICGSILSLMVFGISSYPMQFPAFILSLIFLWGACMGMNNLRSRCMLALAVGICGGMRFSTDHTQAEACRKWMNARVLYRAEAYEAAAESYAALYPLLKSEGAFLFEYGHTLHKLKQHAASNRYLQEAMLHSSDPMILNIIGKNHWEMKDYPTAELWLLRAVNRLPGRIYPYYLLAKLYAEPDFHQPEKQARMKRIVLTKTPKVHSTAIEQMRRELKGDE